jgi:hypothetical protein
MSCILSMVALIGLAIVYRKFLELGGPDNYKAPEPSSKKSRSQVA